MSLCVHKRSTTSLPPCTTFSTPAGIPAWIASSTNIMVDNGSCSEGFKTKVLPHTIAIGNIQSGIMAGKLNGVIPAQTPKGCCKVYVSTPRATPSTYSPICKVPTEQACSTTSRPRWISPSASAKVLPCSAVNTCAISFMLARIKSCSLSMMRIRAWIGVWRHEAKASCAAWIAASTSSTVAKGTRPITSWVAGLTMSCHSCVLDSRNCPLISNLAVSNSIFWIVFITSP